LGSPAGVAGFFAHFDEAQARFAGMALLDIWYDKTTAETIRRDLMAGAAAQRGVDPKVAAARVDALFAKARGKDQLRAVDSLTADINGEWRFVDEPPVVTHVDVPGGPEALARTFFDYRTTLAENRRELVERYRFVDFALKVVGVGSVGTFCTIVLLMASDDDPLFLQVKEARASVLEPYAGKSIYSNHGQRVVNGYRLMQSASDIFLGWTQGAQTDRHLYWRQLRDMKGSADVEAMRPFGLAWYARQCGWTLARAHARSGDPIAIAAYLGKSDEFDRAVTDFSLRYADQNDKDFDAFAGAVRSGRLAAIEGV
jgi:hypothetical protein